MEQYPAAGPFHGADNCQPMRQILKKKISNDADNEHGNSNDQKRLCVPIEYSCFFRKIVQLEPEFIEFADNLVIIPLARLGRATEENPNPPSEIEYILSELVRALGTS